MKLLDFQLEPVRHLVSRCKNQHGAFLQFSQGSGKTYIGLFFAKNYPTKKIILVCPKGIETGWVTLAKKLKVAFYKVIFTENLNDLVAIKNIENCIVIIDEAHHLVMKLRNLQRDISDKIVVKTGPVQGKEKVEREKTILEEILDTMKRCHKILLLSATPVFFRDLSYLAWFFNIASGKNLFPYHREEFDKKYMKRDPVKTVMKYLDTHQKYYSKRLVDTGFDKMIPTPKSKEAVNVTAPVKTFQEKGVEFMGDVVNNLSQELVTSLVFSLKKVANIALRNKIDKMTSWAYVNELDYNKMKIVAPYIFYYNYLEHAEKKLYPSNNFHELYIPYTPYQLDLFARFMNENILTLKEKVLLGMNNSEEEANLFETYSSGTRGGYADLGMEIGNISGIYESKMYTPYKYIKFYSIYRKSPLHHIVYCSSVNGCKAFYAFLKTKNIPCAEITTAIKASARSKVLERFKNKGDQVVILYPEFYHGISVAGARHFHIFEPMSEYQKFQQLKYRVIRYQSHVHLPENQRNVNIYQYICSLKSVFDVLKVQMLKLKKNQEELGAVSTLLKMTSLLSVDYSADTDSYESLYYQEMFYNKLNTMISKISNNKSKLVDTCCVYSDTCPDMFKSCHE